jgi:hypothetical protein
MKGVCTMKRKMALLGIAVVVLCVAAGVSFADDVPNIVGTWTGKCKMHHRQLGFTENDLTYVVEEQQGRVFKGYKTLTLVHNKEKRKETFAGVITKDNKTFYIADHIDGIEFGHIETGEMLTIYYVEAETDIAKAGIIELIKKPK